MNSKLLIGIIAIIVIAGGLYLALGSGKNETSSPIPAPTKTSTQASNQSQNPPKQPTATTITVSASGFSPASVTVKAGTKIIWENKSDGDISVNSDDHPTHRLFKEINIGHIPNSSSNSVVLEKPGKYTYHDHYNPERTGTIIVE